FDTGHLVFVHELIRDGLIDDPPLIQLCTGIPYGAPDDLGTLLAMVNRLPENAVYSAFSIGRMELPFVALAPLVGANVRVGLEDNLYLSRGRLATNGELVARAVEILERMNVRVLGPDEVREQLAAADRAAPPDALVCSSTSGLRPSELQAEMERPERFCVAHPFNPVYLLPLVELCAGERTAPETVERAQAVFRSVGMHPLV